ncbi:hypothetical protein RCO48_38595 [Peribacillus frigoritolerans]|nr:hypothetical protein [Peribacillus frigoritolerans]
MQKNNVLPPLEADEKEDSGVDKGGLKKHIEELRSAFVNEELPVLGRQPDDLLDVLVSYGIRIASRLRGQDARRFGR